MSTVIADRLALVGAASQMGKEIKNQLAAAGVPGDRIDLMDLEDEVGLVTDYGDEARVVLEAAEEPIRRAKLACFCGDPAAAGKLAQALVHAGGVAIDCTGAWADDDDAVMPGRGGDGPRIVSAPHPAAALLASLAEAVDFDAVAVTVLLPASESHERGPDEMARQSVELLNFGLGDLGEAEGRRTAFDLWPGGHARERVLRHLERMGLTPPRLAVVRAPVFHGIAAALFVHGVGADELRGRLENTHVSLPTGDDAVDSPARAAGKTGVHVTGLGSDGGGAWLWAVADNYAVAAASAVAEIVATLAPGDEVVS